MTASEKLRRLAEPWLADDDYPDDGSVGRVMDALPALIAVAEAAENPNALRGDLDRALAALDEALEEK